jgi:hypothetical protein
LLGGKLLVRRRHRHPCSAHLGMIYSENRCPLFGIMPSLPDAQSITNPHNPVPAVRIPLASG